jgi:hypothetical protein
MILLAYSVVYSVSRFIQNKKATKLAAHSPDPKMADEPSHAHQNSLLKGGASHKANPVLKLMQAHGLARP